MDILGKGALPIENTSHEIFAAGMGVTKRYQTNRSGYEDDLEEVERQDEWILTY